MTGKARTAVAGEVPNPLDPPPGCTFHPRCPLANERCRRENPVLRPSRRRQHGAVACHAVEEGRLPPRRDAGRARTAGVTARAGAGSGRLSAIIATFGRAVRGAFPHVRGTHLAARTSQESPLRLTQIKLAGFKSFVDPTTIAHARPARRHRRPQRLRQVERHRRRALGARRVEGLRAARRIDAGRHLQRRRRAQARRPRVGRAAFRQQPGPHRRPVGPVRRALDQARADARRRFDVLHQQHPGPAPRHPRPVPRHRAWVRAPTRSSSRG